MARDLVLQVHETLGPRGTTPVLERREMLGGKGANQCVGVAQLGVPVALVGVVGDDVHGRRLVADARADGIDTSHVVDRVGVPTALITSVVDAHGWRYFEHLPAESLVAPVDVAQAAAVLARASTAVIQLQQPSPSVRAAARIANRHGVPVVLDGAPSCADRDAPVGAAVRADSRETELLADGATPTRRRLWPSHGIW